MYSSNYEESNVKLNSNEIAAKIKEVILEMNIMREKRVSRDDLIKLMRDYGN